MCPSLLLFKTNSFVSMEDFLQAYKPWIIFEPSKDSKRFLMKVPCAICFGLILMNELDGA
jgi:hypothetical protein